MIRGRQIIDYVIYHCPCCAGGLEFDIAPLLPYGNIHEIQCPWCNGVFCLDILDPTLQHRIYSPIDEAFK